MLNSPRNLHNSVTVVIYHEEKVFIDVLVLVPSLILMYLNISSIRASKKPEDCINLSFPFKDGRYIITDGGDGKISALLNYHNKAQIHKNGKTNTC